MLGKRNNNTKPPFHPRLADLDLDLLGEGEDDFFVQEKILSWEADQDTNEYQGLFFPDMEKPTERGEQLGNLFDFTEEIEQ